MELDTLARTVQQYHPSPDLDLIRRAFDFARAHPALPPPKSGAKVEESPIPADLIGVPLLVCRLKLDVPSVAASILRRVFSDPAVTRELLVEQFGAEIADIVDGVKKLTRVHFESTEEEQAESFRRMLLAMAKDIRVVLVKLCERVYVLRHIDDVPVAAREQLANESLEIYAPLANRLGIHWIKSELEDLCLSILHPEEYRLIRDSFDKTGRERDDYIAETTREIAARLEEAGVSAAIKGRCKHFYSIWQKMERNDLAFDEVHDLLGFRIIVPTIRACYETLGVIHATWKPVPNRFKDYIAMPKPNMYQSLHTTIIGPAGRRVEVQIRTADMNKIAEEGVAAHWRYKEGKGDPGFDLQWVKELVETQQYLKNSEEFIQSVKGELFPEEVFVFTPRGDLIRLSFGSTPVDFAYAVHTDVGHRTTGARVNGSIVPLDHRLQNGDTVEVLTAKHHLPSKDWLRFVKSSKAKQRIRGFLKAEEHERSVSLGQEILAKELRRHKASLKRLEKEGKLLEAAQALGFKTEGELYANVGYGKVPPPKIVAKLVPASIEPEEKAPARADAPLERIFQRAAKVSRQKVGVRVSGLNDILVRFAKCCEPLPGDRIIGFVTRGRGVTVHHVDCSHVLDLDPLRRVEVLWDDEVQSTRKVRLTIHSQDQVGILANMSQAITSSGANINSAQCKAFPTGKAVNVFEIVVADAAQLERVKRALEMVPGVIRVERASPLGVGVAEGDDSE